MRLAIMQPYFFPHLGHFSLIAACDEWIVFDVSQYTKRSWMSRNRVLHPVSGWQWASVPLAGASIHMRTDAARLLDPASACRRLLGQLSHYRHAPHYRAVVALVTEVFSGTSTSLVELNVRGLSAVCRLIGLPFRCRVASALRLDLPPDPGPGGWAPAICAALEATSYVNPAGGRALFDPEDFVHRGIDLHFLQAAPFRYATGPYGFEPGLSILDVLMWNEPEVIRDAARGFELVPATALAAAA